ncbi:MAG TPA: hypothetical protein VFC96_07210 [Anaerovoracaceae bacterium]|nr:hypothetical protein [Anaerovoracaceae bacterium]
MSHLSAAKYWKVPNLDQIIGFADTNCKLVDFTVSSRAKYYSRKGCKIHLCTSEIPKGGVINCSGNLVASPELVFLQLASGMDLLNTILLGLQLCSSTPKNKRKSITTKRKLRNFMNKMSGQPGIKKANRALKYIENGSASIMESLVYMILTLPNSLGGYGLDGIVFNYRVDLENEAVRRLNQRSCYVDIYYKAEKIAVEYDSFAFHNSPKEQGRDAVRSAILHRHGIEVLHMNTIQLYDVKASDDFAKNLAIKLGKRINIRAEQYKKMRDQLRNLLP